MRREVGVAEHDDARFRFRSALPRRPSPEVGCGRRRVVAASETAAASETGPVLSPLSSSRATWPDVASPLMSVSAQLLRARLDELLRRVAVARRPDRRHRSRERVRGQQVEVAR